MKLRLNSKVVQKLDFVMLNEWETSYIFFETDVKEQVIEPEKLKLFKRK